MSWRSVMITRPTKLSIQNRQLKITQEEDFSIPFESRLCNGTDMTNKHLKRLNTILPEKGSVRCLTVTEKQYENMKFLVGKPSIKEKKINSNQLTLF